MNSKKRSKPTKEDKARQEGIEKRLKAEKVELGHPGGKERFERVIRRFTKKTKK